MFPKIKKSILDFILDEGGKCTKKSIVSLGILSLALSAATPSVEGAGRRCTITQDTSKIGLRAGAITGSVSGSFGGYSLECGIELEFSMAQLVEAGVYGVPKAGYKPIGTFDPCTIVEGGLIKDHVSDGGCCNTTDHLSAEGGNIDIPSLYYHKNSLFVESETGSVLTAKHSHAIEDMSPGAIPLKITDHADHYNSGGNPCGHDDTNHVSSGDTEWFTEDSCGTWENKRHASE